MSSEWLVGESTFSCCFVHPAGSPRGYSEREHHLTLLREGAEGYGVLCVAADPEADGARRIASFDRDTLLRFGTLVEFEKGTYAEIVGRVAADTLTRAQTSGTTLAAELKAILRSSLEPTEREALLSARIGQGAFRSQVLEEWGGRCAVTGATTLDVIRASHIKPWRLSSNAERLDPTNGIPLVATFDALFDAGLITFRPDGEMLLSSLNFHGPDLA